MSAPGPCLAWRCMPGSAAAARAILMRMASTACRRLSNLPSATRSGLPQVERALEAGDSVLVENMGESIDAVIMPVVTRAFFKKGRSMYVKIGD